MSDEKDSQQEAPHESGLQTPQPDQRLPTEEERREAQPNEKTEIKETTEVTETVEKSSSEE